MTNLALNWLIIYEGHYFTNVVAPPTYNVETLPSHQKLVADGLVRKTTLGSDPAELSKNWGAYQITAKGLLYFKALMDAVDAVPLPEHSCEVVPLHPHAIH